MVEFSPTKIGAQSAQIKMTAVGSGFSWQSYSEGMVSSVEGSFTGDGLMEQINVTRDTTDYLWYTTE